MSEPARYTFMPWLRQGIAAKIREKDVLGGQLPGNASRLRASLPVTLKLKDTNIKDGSTDTTLMEKDIKIIGPGDIVGIHKDAIVRTEPKKNEVKFEANCLAYIEFYEEDFIWRYTPASPEISGSQAHKLRPWLALIILTEDEFTYQTNLEGLSFITVQDGKLDTVFPPHTQTWAWAHVQVNQELTQPAGSEALIEELSSLLMQNPDAAVCRLLCPRKMKKETAYHAFLVPAFETGRLAGLGEPIPDIAAQEPAWKTGEAPAAGKKRPYDFPVYHEWKFKTGLYGDFESLVSILKSNPLDPELGKRPMDIQKPGYGLNENVSPALNSVNLGLEGSIKPPDFVSDPWPHGSGDDKYQQQLRDILNVPENMQAESYDPEDLPDNPFYNEPIPDDPIIMPPIYGKNQAAIRCLGDAGNPAWVDALNEDPRTRAVAGLGAQVVQKNQDKLMESAWQQIGEVNAANQKIREAELSRQVNRALFNKHLKNRSSDTFLAATSAMHKSLLPDTGTDAKTVQHAIETSQVPPAAKSAGFRRIIRPGKKSNRRMNESSQNDIRIHKQVIPNFNRERDEATGQEPLTAARPKVVPDMVLNTEAIHEDINQALNDFQEPKSLAMHTFLEILAALRQPALDRPQLLQALSERALDNAAAITYVEQMINQVENYRVDEGITEVRLSKVLFKELCGDYMTGKSHDWVLVYRSLDSGEEEHVTRMITLEELQTYQAVFTDFSGMIRSTQSLPQVLPPLAVLDQFSNSLKNSLDPLYTITKRVTHAIKVWSQAQQKFVRLQTLKPVMAHPTFPQPMFHHLKKLSQEFILPNMNKIPQNTLLLLESNQKFIEAYLAGVNHEMARELLWREYPTDQRGTYFEKFWDTKDNIVALDESQKKDILPMHKWKTDLGTHSPRSGNYLVLLIRGELFQKYPNTIVYAQRAAFAADLQAPRQLAETEDLTNTSIYRFPVFQGSLDTDVVLFGFDLDKHEARGNRADNPGWFFILKERPGELRFGMDDVAIDRSTGEIVFPADPAGSWSDLNWAHLVNDAAAMDALGQIDLQQPIRLTGNLITEWQNANAANFASILFQNPVIFARHAQEMLP